MTSHSIIPKNTVNFIVEKGIDIYKKNIKHRDGQWKRLAMNLKAPEPDPEDPNKKIYYSVSKTDTGTYLTNKQSASLLSALAREGHKGIKRKNGENGYRVWRVLGSIAASHLLVAHGHHIAQLIR